MNNSQNLQKKVLSVYTYFLQFLEYALITVLRFQIKVT